MTPHAPLRMCIGMSKVGSRIVAQQIDPDPPVITFDSVEVEEG